MLDNGADVHAHFKEEKSPQFLESFSDSMIRNSTRKEADLDSTVRLKNDWAAGE